MSVDIEELKAKAVEFRKDILHTTNAAGSGHPGGSLSCVEILIALYGYKMRYKADDPKWADRDRLVMSKGHASPAMYVTLANFGFFDKAELKNFRQFGSMLQGHVVALRDAVLLANRSDDAAVPCSHNSRRICSEILAVGCCAVLRVRSGEVCRDDRQHAGRHRADGAGLLAGGGKAERPAGH